MLKISGSTRAAAGSSSHALIGTHSENSFISQVTGLLTTAKDQPINRVAPVAGAGVCLSPSVSGSQISKPHVAGSRTPVPLPRKPLSVSSPSPDEEAARCLRSQLEEVERRIAAEHAASCDPQAELKDKVNQMSLENALLRKTLAASPDHWLEHKNLAKEAERITLNSSPTEDNYKAWRSSLGVAVVAAAGPNRAEAPDFFDTIESDCTPLWLAENCPVHFQNLDSKIASLVSTIVKGPPGDRIALAIERQERIVRYSGRAIVKIIDDEFGHLSRESRAALVAQLYKLRPATTDFIGLESFMQTLERILLQLHGTKEQPSDLFIRTMLEDQVEARFTLRGIAAEVSAYRVTDVESPASLIRAICAACKRDRMRNSRAALTAPATLENPETKRAAIAKSEKVAKTKAKSGNSQPSAAKVVSAAVSYCYNFAKGTCQKGKTCGYVHQLDPSKPKPAPKANAPTSNAKPVASKVPCHFFRKGRCTSGANCRFSHSDVEPDSQAPKRSGAAIVISDESGVVRSAVSCIVPQSVIAAPSAALDSGSGVNLVGANDVPNDREVEDGAKLRLHTANGIIESTKVVQTQVPLPGPELNVESRVLADSPNVLSMGQMCMKHGYGVLWPPADLPVLFTPDGRCFQVPLEYFVPVISQDLSALHPTQAQTIFENFTTTVLKTCAEVSAAASLKMFTNEPCLLEYCCSSDSQLGKSGAELGINVQRFGLDFGDLSSPEAIDRAVAVAESAPPGTCGWLSLPCSPWSVLQNLNIAIAEKKGPAVIKALRFRLKRERAKSIVMLNGFARVARVLRAKGGYIAKEWPRHCHGWQDGNVLAFESEFSLQRCFVDACTQGLCCPKTGLPLKKPFCISTNCPTLLSALAADQPVLCKGQHPKHGESMSGNASMTELYTPAFARLMLKGLFPNCVHAAPGLEVAVIDREAELRKQALSPEHLVSHLPANPYCPHCCFGKQRRVQHRRIATEEVETYKGSFGQHVYGDHIISQNCIGLNGETCACVLFDRAKKASYPYPAEAKSAEETEIAIRHFLGSHVYASTLLSTDGSKEFESAASRLGVVHQQSAPHAPETHGIQEREEQTLLQGARTCLHQSQLPLSFWPFAIRHFAVARMLQKNILQPLQNGRTEHPFLHVPFGAVVSVKAPPVLKVQSLALLDSLICFLAGTFSPACSSEVNIGQLPLTPSLRESLCS